jgi:hypothetical protein
MLANARSKLLLACLPIDASKEVSTARMQKTRMDMMESQQKFYS